VKPRVLLDCDNVLSDFVGPCLKVLHQITGETYRREDVTAFNVMKSLDVPNDVADTAYAQMKGRGFCRSLPVFEGAQEGVAKLKKVAHVFVVTSPLGGLYWAGEREEWLHRLFGFGRENVIQASAKYTISGDILVDDKTTTLVRWMKYHPGIAVQWETPHNRDDGWMGPSTENWDELVGMAKALKGPPPMPRNPFYRNVPGTENAV